MCRPEEPQPATPKYTEAEYPWPPGELGVSKLTQFPKDKRDLKNVDPSNARAYIQAMIEVTADEAKSYTLVATVEVGAVVFLVKDSLAAIQSKGNPATWIASFAMLALSVSAALLYYCSVKINRRRTGIARTLTTNNAEHARDLWYDDVNGLKSVGRGYRRAGFICLGLGIAAAVVVVAILLMPTQPQPPLTP